MIDDIPQLDGSNKSKYRRYIARIVLFNVIVQVFMILYCAMILWGFDIKYLILYAWFLDLSGFLQLVVERSNGKFYTLLYFLEKLGSIIFKVLNLIFRKKTKVTIIINFEVHGLFLFYIPSAQIIFSLIILVLQFQKQFWPKKKHIVIQQMLYIIYLLQILVLTFKWNGLFNYSYYQVFIITWCIQAVNAFIVILLIVCCMENCYHVNNTRVQSNYFNFKKKQKASVLTWIIFYFVGLSAIPFITLRNICDWYESKGLVSQQPLFVIIVCTQVYCILLGYQSYVVRDDIVIFLKNEYKTDIRDTITRQATQIQSQKSQSPRKWRRLRIPLLFLRISGSYFKLLGRRKTNSTSSKCTTMTVSQKYHDSQRPESLNQSPCITIKQLRSSEQEQKSLESCLVCFENEPDVILMPCQHGGICQQCADSIIEKTKQCYLCRNEIAVALKVVKRDSLLEAINVQKL